MTDLLQVQEQLLKVSLQDVEACARMVAERCRPAVVCGLRCRPAHAELREARSLNKLLIVVAAELDERDVLHTMTIEQLVAMLPSLEAARARKLLAAAERDRKRPA